MPLYEYQCDACGLRFEVIQKFSDAAVDKCGACGGTVKKLVSSPALQFKGSGWYVTDYARKPDEKGTPAAGSSSPPASSSESAPGGKESSSAGPAAPAPGASSKDS